MHNVTLCISGLLRSLLSRATFGWTGFAMREGLLNFPFWALPISTCLYACSLRPPWYRLVTVRGFPFNAESQNFSTQRLVWICIRSSADYRFRLVEQVRGKGGFRLLKQWLRYSFLQCQNIAEIMQSNSAVQLSWTYASALWKKSLTQFKAPTSFPTENFLDMFCSNKSPLQVRRPSVRKKTDSLGLYCQCCWCDSGLAQHRWMHCAV